MSYSDPNKMLKQLKGKPASLQKFNKYNVSKDRKHGVATKRCRRCGRIRGHISMYHLNLCRQCFREIASKIGFKKFN